MRLVIFTLGVTLVGAIVAGCAASSPSPRSTMRSVTSTPPAPTAKHQAAFDKFTFWQVPGGTAATTFPPPGGVKVLGGERLVTVRFVQISENDVPTRELEFVFDSPGAKTLSNWTSANVGHDLAVYDGARLLEVATVREPITEGGVAVRGPRVIQMYEGLKSPP